MSRKFTSVVQQIKSVCEKCDLISVICQADEVAADCVDSHPFLKSFTYGIAGFEYRLNHFKGADDDELLSLVEWSNNDLRFKVGDGYIRCHRVHRKTLVPIAAKKLKKESYEKKSILLPGIQDFIKEEMIGTPYIGIISNRTEGVKEIFIGLMQAFSRGKYNCERLHVLYKQDDIGSEANSISIRLENEKYISNVPQYEQRVTKIASAKKTDNDNGVGANSQMLVRYDKGRKSRKNE